MPQKKYLAYLDHNVLDLLVKGKYLDLAHWFSENSIVPVFSHQSLTEIHQSTGSEDQFVQKLRDIKAQYIEPVVDHSLRHTGEFQISHLDPEYHYELYKEKLDQEDFSDFGMSKLLQKFYGGMPDESFSSIAKEGLDEARSLLKSLLFEAKEELTSPNSSISHSEIEKVIDEIHGSLRSSVEQLDAIDFSSPDNFQDVYNAPSRVLNNISPPNVVEKIWNLYEGSLVDTGINIDIFFGLAAMPGVEPQTLPHTTMEKINAVYHQLNYIGYFRDKNMKNPRYFRSHIADMSHAAIASSCHFLISRDFRMIRKARASYEYLGVQTVILRFEEKEDSQGQST